MQINVTKAAKRNAKAKSETVSFAEIGAALIAAATPATVAKPDAKAAARAISLAHCNALRAIAKIAYPGASLVIHCDAKKHPVSFYAGRVSGTDTAGHGARGETDRTSSGLLCAYLSRDAADTVSLHDIYFDKSVTNFMRDLRFLTSAPDATRQTFTATGLSRGAAILALHADKLRAAGLIDAAGNVKA